MWELIAKLEQLPAWELTMYRRELEAGGPFVYLASSAGSNHQREDQGEVDKEGGNLYNHIKMLYEDNFGPENGRCYCTVH